MKKISLMYNPNGILILSLFGIFVIVRTLFIDFNYVQGCLLAAIIALPIMLWQKKYMEENMDKYVLLATNSLKTLEEIKERGPEKALVISGVAVILLVLNIITKIPFIWMFLALGIILYPTYKKIASKTELK